MNQRHADEISQPRPDIPGISIMTVYDVRPLTLFMQQRGERINQAIEMIPKLFFGQIPVWAGIEAENPHAVAE